MKATTTSVSVSPVLLFVSLLLAAGSLWSQTIDGGAVAAEPERTLPTEPCNHVPGQGPEMIIIEAGAFQMGSPSDDTEAEDDERPAHPVSLFKPFALARCETSVGEFKRFIDETSYQTDAERGDGCYALKADGSSGEQRADANWRNPGFEQTDDHPVVCVSYNDAEVYARWLSLRTGIDYRLPTEAEWEYAARGGTGGPRFWPGGPDSGCDYANGADRTMKERFPDWAVADCDDGALFTAPGGGYRRNGFGLSDIAGNAWEWVQDCWHDNYDDAPGDGAAWLDANGGDCARRVLRGGSWSHLPRYLGSAYRYRYTADGGDHSVGFRLARTLQQPFSLS